MDDELFWDILVLDIPVCYRNDLDIVRNILFVDVPGDDIPVPVRIAVVPGRDIPVWYNPDLRLEDTRVVFYRRINHCGYIPRSFARNRRCLISNQHWI